MSEKLYYTSKQSDCFEHVIKDAQNDATGMFTVDNGGDATNENVINAYHNEPDLWATEVNVWEEAKELAWRRLCDLFELSSAGK